MPPSRRLVACVLTLAVLSAVAAPRARTAEGDDFPVPQSDRFT